MKKQLLLILVALLPMVAWADAVEINGIKYNLISKLLSAEVVGTSISTGSIIIPEMVSYDGISYSVTTICDYCFRDCGRISSITIPKTIQKIGKEAFWNCLNLESVHISDIDAWCNILFENARSNPMYFANHLYLNDIELKDLIIPTNITSIANYTFFGCGNFTSVSIPNNVTSIGECAFSDCSGLTSVTIPNGVAFIGTSAFTGCSSLKYVSLPNSIKTISYGAFSSCSNLSSVTIPSGVTSIENNVFYGCSGMEFVTIPNNVTSIGKGAFEQCSGLTYVTIGNRVTSIGEQAFSYCSGLTSVTIPNSVTSIGNGTFNGCNGLTSVTIGSGIKTIGSQAFASCKELTDVYCYAENVPSTQTDAFKDSYIEYATLHVPAASVETYKAAVPWKNFKEVVSLSGDTPEPPVTPQCATPTISYQNGELSFGCATEGVEFISEITDTDIKKYYTNKVQLTATYNISVYATKTGYENSDVATATLCWIDKEPVIDVTNISQVPAQAILIQSEGGVLTVQGLDDGQQVRVYGIDGRQAGAAVSSNGQATVGTSLPAGSVAIIKIGDRSVKVVVK